MGKKLRSFADWRAQESQSEYIFHYNNFKKLIMSMFEWKDLPAGIPQRFIERTLFNTGLVVFYKSKSAGCLVCANATPVGVNLYEEPVGFRTYSSNNMVNELVKAEDCVPIWNNQLQTSSVYNVNYFAKRLSGLEKTLDINIEQLKNPYIVTCPEGQLATLKGVMTSKSNGEPYIVVTEDFTNAVSMQVFDLHIKNYSGDLQQLRREFINDGLTFFGVNNVITIKKERLVSGEADQNNEQIKLAKVDMFKERLDAVKAINEMFDCNVSLEIGTNLENEYDKFMESMGDING